MDSDSYEPLQRHLRQWSGMVRRSGFTAVGLVALVALVGGLSALAVSLFEEGIAESLHLGFTALPQWLQGHGVPGWSGYLLYPALLGLAVAGVKRLVPAPDRHHSIPLVIISLLKRDGKIRPVSTVLKTIASMITLGAGGSLGREGPVVLLGSGLGSAVGQTLRLPPDWINTLVAAGAAAAISTAFQAPITGALFAMELILSQFSSRSFALVALASVTASQVARALVGNPPFPIPGYQLGSSWEIPFYLALGLVTALVSRLYITVLYGSESLGARIKALPVWIKPALGGILFGAVALALPRTLAGGYETIQEALLGNLPLTLLLVLLAGKLLTIGLTSGSGWPGGVFTPALFLGSMTGGAFGLIAQRLFPDLITQPGAYAVVGMAAMIAGATHAPLTAMTLIFEITRDYRIALPAMLACGVAAVFSQRISPYSVDTLHLPEQGVLLPWQVQDLRGVRVHDAMSGAVHTVQSGMELSEVITVMQRFRHGGFPVVDAEGRLVGMVTLRDVREVPLERRLATPVEKVMSRNLVVITPEQTLADAALLMAKHKVGRLPVVDPDDNGKLLGLVSRSDVLRAYPSEAPVDQPVHGH